MQSMGFGRGFPALAVGRHRLNGFQEHRWAAALANSGYPGASLLPQRPNLERPHLERPQVESPQIGWPNPERPYLERPMAPSGAFSPDSIPTFTDTDRLGAGTLAAPVAPMPSPVKPSPGKSR
jgi:hypothetical protein